MDTGEQSREQQIKQQKLVTVQGQLKVWIQTTLHLTPVRLVRAWLQPSRAPPDLPPFGPSSRCRSTLVRLLVVRVESIGTCRAQESKAPGYPEDKRQFWAE